MIRAGRSGVRAGAKMFPFTKTSRLALGPTKPPIQLVPELKRLGLEVNYSPPYDAEVRNEWRSYGTSAGVSLHGLEKVK